MTLLAEPVLVSSAPPMAISRVSKEWVTKLLKGHNKDQTQIMGAITNKESTTTEPPP